jgi:glycosyltransferase involved in cell wall biosynthesis
MNAIGSNQRKKIILVFWGAEEYGGVPTMFKNIQQESITKYELDLVQIKTFKDLKIVLKLKDNKIIVSMTPIIGILPILNLFGFNINVYFHSIIEWKGYRLLISLVACLFTKKLYVTQKKALPRFIERVINYNEIGIAFKPLKEKNLNERKITSLLTVSRLDPIKQVPELVNSIDTFLVQNNIKLDIIGNGEDLLKINSSKNITLKGFVPNQEIDWKNHDALIINSLQEGFPVVALEALSSGVGVIARDIGNLKELSKEFENIWIFNSYEELQSIIKTKRIKPSINEIENIELNYGDNKFANNF